VIYDNTDKQEWCINTIDTVMLGHEDLFKWCWHHDN